MEFTHGGGSRQRARACRRCWPKPFGQAAVLTAFAVTVLFGTTANAQVAPGVEVSANYSLLSSLDEGGTLPTGVYGSAAWRVTRWLSAVGEVGWQGESQRFEGAFAGDEGFVSERDLTTILGGGRFIPWSSQRAVVFADILIGSRRERGHVAEVLGRQHDFFPRFDVEITLTDAVLQPGGGITIRLSPRIGAQTSLHYRRTFGRSLEEMRLPDIGELRLGTGITVGF